MPEIDRGLSATAHTIHRERKMLFPRPCLPMCSMATPCKWVRKVGREGRVL